MMIILRAKIEEDRKKKGAVIGRIIFGPDSGKIVFFNGQNKPLIGNAVFLDEVDDKGRFLIAKKWRVQKEEERTAALRILMGGKIEYSVNRTEFIKYNSYMLESSGPQSFINNYFESIVTALKWGIDGDEKLLEQVNQFKQNLSSFSDIVAEQTVAFLDVSEEIFEKGGDLIAPKKTDEFKKLLASIIQVSKTSAWPTRGMESGITREGRSFCPTDA